MNKTVPILEQEYKDHSLPNPVRNLDNEALPFGSRDVHMHPIRNLEITIQVLDERTQEVIETITGKADSGDVNMDSNSLIRRTLSLTMSVDPDLFPKPDSLMWFGKILRVYAGLTDMTENDRQLNFLLGTFWLDEGGYSIDDGASTLDFSLSDKMTKYEDVETEYAIIIPQGVPIDEAIRLVMESVGETEFGEMQVLNRNYVVPYTLEYGIGENVMSIIEEVRDLYMDCVCGYNIKGQFEFKKLNIQRQTDVAEPKFQFDANASDRADLTLSFDESYNLKEIRNRIIVYGGTNELTGMTPRGEVRITDPDSPFNIDAIGERKKIMIEDGLFTNDQCVSWGRYHAWKLSNFQEVANIDTVPIYILDAHDIIEVTHPYTGKIERYMIDDFSLGLGVDETMSITAHKLYYVTLEYGEEVVELIQHFENGIYNWGWLSLGEQRIHEAFNMSGSGEATLTVRFIDNVLGGMQASVTSYDTTKNQTMLIDLADFSGLDPTSPSGDNGRSTGDYADRVLGHEMFHAVINDYLGHSKVLGIPLWFNEGMAEFLHGARERFSVSYIDLNDEDKKQAMIDRASDMFDGLWAGDNNDYAVAYMMAIAIYEAQTSQEWDGMFQRLRESENISLNFLYKLLPNLGTSHVEIKSILLNTMRNMDVWGKLFDKTEVDTGSVGGEYFMNLYGTPLTAETVFNNADATIDSIGFNLRIER